MNDKVPVGKFVAKFAAATINPEKQNIESVHRIVGQILKLAGCGDCGRAAILKINFLGDPPPDLRRDGVISFNGQF